MRTNLHFFGYGWFLLFVLALVMGLTFGASAQSLTQLSQDTFVGGDGQHNTEVEPAAFTYGSTIVTSFQVARIFGGGGMDIGFATSRDGGATWTSGLLPGLTINEGGGVWDAASDTSVAYDAKHGVWLISTLPIGNNTAVAVSRSTDGLNWGNPILVTQSGGPDKSWLVCDNSSKSPFYGNCYQEWDSTFAGDLLQVSTSSDGGLTWGPAMGTAGSDFGIGGVPVVQPNGNVVVPFLSFFGSIQAFTSTNGGASWNAATTVASFINHFEAGDIRSAGLPSSAIDKTGRVWVAWSDCRFRSGCSANDIVYSVLGKSGKRVSWSAVQRIPIDPVTSTVDHFITGMAIEPGTSGKKTHVGLVYYYYPVSNCTTCELSAGFIQSSNNGKTWSPAQTLGGPMDLSWLPSTFSGQMVADYIAVAFGTGGKAYPVFALANAPVGGLFQQGTYTSTTGLAPAGPAVEQLSSAGDQPVPNAHSDHGPMEYLDLEHRIPRTGQTPPEKR
jgi:hypothetical protein